MPRASSILLAALLLVGLPFARAGEPTLERLAPDSALALVRFPDLAASRKALAGAPLGRWLGEPLKQLLAALDSQRELRELRGQLLQGTGLSLAEASALLSGELGVAVLAIDDGGPQLLLALGHGPGEAAAAAMKTLVAHLDETHSPKTSKRGELSLRAVDLGGQTLAYTVLGRKLLLTLGPPELLGQALARSEAAEAAGSLASAERYRAFRAATREPEAGEHLTVYLDAGASWAKAAELLPAEARRAATRLGVASWRGAGYTSWQRGGQLIDQLALQGAGDEGLLAQLAGGGLGEAIEVPAGAGHLSAAIDAPRALGLIRQATAAADPGSADQLTQLLDRIKREQELDVEAWLKSLGHRVDTYSWPARFGLAPRTLHAVAVKDQAAFLSGLKAAVKALRFELVEHRHKGQLILHWRPLVGRDWEDQLPNNPARLVAAMLPSNLLIKDGRAYLADHHRTLTQWLDGDLTAKGTRQIKLPADTLIDGEMQTSRMLLGLYGTMRLYGNLIEATWRSMGLDVDLRFFPAAEDIGEGLKAERWRLRRTEQGLQLRTEGLYGGGGVLIGAAAAAVAALVPQVARMQDSANKANCKNNFKQLALCLILWRDNQGRAVNWPPLKSLVSRTFVDGVTDEVDLFQVPGYKVKITAEDIRANRVEKFGFVQTPWPIYSNKGASERPILWTRQGVYKGVRIVLYMDGHVEEVEEAQWARELAALKERCARYKASGATHHHLKSPKAAWAVRKAKLAKLATKPSEDDAIRIDNLINKLGNRSYRVRTAAKASLQKLGKPAIAALFKAAKDGADLETRRGAEQVLKQLADELLKDDD